MRYYSCQEGEALTDPKEVVMSKFTTTVGTTTIKGILYLYSGRGVIYYYPAEGKSTHRYVDYHEFYQIKKELGL